MTAAGLSVAARKHARVRGSIRKGKRKQTIFMPRWVSGSFGSEGVRLPRKEDSKFAPRMQFWPLGRQLPGGGDSRNMFRGRIQQKGLREDCGHRLEHWKGFKHWSGACLCKWSSRCHVPEGLYTTHRPMDDGLVAARQFLEGLRHEMGQMFGSVGVNKGMRDLVRLSSTCWDWGFLVRESPRAQHVQAFLGVVRLLRPFLAHTITPDRSQFPGATDVAPESTDNELVRTYELLTLRVRAVAGSATLKQKRKPPLDVIRHAVGWQTLLGYDVQPLYTFNIVHKLVASSVSVASWPRTHLNTMICYSASLISQFMGSLGEHKRVELAKACWGSFAVRPRHLLAVGEKRVRQAKKSAEQHRVGSICAFQQHTDKRRHLVLVTRLNFQVQVDQISAAIDLLPWFATGTGEGARSSWMAGRVHHRCRVLYPPEAVCERLGSIMHDLFDPGQHLTPGPLVDRLLLAQAYVWCCGSARDEWLVRETANVLEKVFHKSATLKARRRKQGLPQAACIRHQTQALEASGRSFADIDVTWEDWWAQVACGGELPRPAASLRKEAWRAYTPRELPAPVAQAISTIRARDAHYKGAEVVATRRFVLSAGHIDDDFLGW